MTLLPSIEQMNFLIFAGSVAAGMFLGSLCLLELGRYLGAKHIARDGVAATAGLSAVEGAVFALMGLLLAFSLSGALQRFDERRLLILQEANAISTAYDRLGVLPGESKHRMRASLKRYVEVRLSLYRDAAAFDLAKGAAKFSGERQNIIEERRAEVWDGVIAACPASQVNFPCSLILPAINNVFETARIRSGANERHPPQVIYVMLFCMGLGGSLLAGYGMAANKTRSWVHMVVFAAALSATLYVITNLEFPRLGFIRVDHYDHFLDDVLSQM